MPLQGAKGVKGAMREEGWVGRCGHHHKTWRKSEGHHVSIDTLSPHPSTKTLIFSNYCCQNKVSHNTNKTIVKNLLKRKGCGSAELERSSIVNGGWEGPLRFN